MKVVKVFGLRDLRLADAPVPQPGFGCVRVKVKASGICGSDKWVWFQEHPSDNIAGHEVSGEVDLLGEGVTALGVGDRVIINNVVGCGVCPACRAGEFVFCPKWDWRNDVNNGFGEYVVTPARNCMRLPDCLDYIDGALIMDNWGTPYANMLRGNVQAGMDVLVNGCGPIGQAAIALCRERGAYVIAADPVKWRRQAALKQGAHHALGPEELPCAAQKLTDGLGVHVVMECSGAGASYENCLASLRIGGTLVAVGEHAEYTYNSSDIIRRSLNIASTWYSTLPHAAEVMQMALQKRIDLRSFLTHTVRLEDVPRMFASLMSLEDGIMKCVIVYD